MVGRSCDGGQWAALAWTGTPWPDLQAMHDWPDWEALPLAEVLEQIAPSGPVSAVDGSQAALMQRLQEVERTLAGTVLWLAELAQRLQAAAPLQKEQPELASAR